MIKLYDSQITDILPDYFAGRAEVQSLSYAIHMAVMRLMEYCSYIGVFSAVDTAPDYVLDRLALDLNTQYYDAFLEIGAKRNLIKNTLAWYQTAGTPGAVEELVMAVFGGGKVPEWFEYGGQPYRFKIQSDAILGENMLARFQRIIGNVKNLRSHLEAIEICRTVDQALYGGAAVYCKYIRAAAVTDDPDA